MNTAALEKAVLELPERDRKQLVHALLESLDQPSEANVEQHWLREAALRAEEIDQGKVRLLTSEELETQVQALLE